MCWTSRGYKPEEKKSSCHGNVRLGRLILELALVICFETYFMDETEDYFGLLAGQHVSVIIIAIVVACYGKTAKTPSAEQGINSRHVSSIFMLQLCFHLPMCGFTLSSSPFPADAILQDLEEKRWMETHSLTNLHHWQVITYDKPVLIPSMSVTWSLTLQTEAQGALWHEARAHRV